MSVNSYSSIPSTIELIYKMSDEAVPDVEAGYIFSPGDGINRLASLATVADPDVQKVVLDVLDDDDATDESEDEFLDTEVDTEVEVLEEQHGTPSTAAFRSHGSLVSDDVDSRASKKRRKDTVVSSPSNSTRSKTDKSTLR